MSKQTRNQQSKEQTTTYKAKKRSQRNAQKPSHRKTLSLGMPRVGANTMSQADLRARYWGTARHNGVVPRTNADVLFALNSKHSSKTLLTAHTLAQCYATDHPDATAADLFGADYDDAPLTNYFTGGGIFFEGRKDAQGLTRDGITLLDNAVGILLGLCLGGGSARDLVVEDALSKVKEAEAKVALGEAVVAQKSLLLVNRQDEIKALEELLSTHGIERPVECINCGAYKTTAEAPMETKTYSLLPRMVLVEVLDEETGETSMVEEAETNGGAGDFFANTWNTCSKGDGADGMCRDCSFADMGMLNPMAKAGNRNDVGGFAHYVPTCCFHQGPISTSTPCCQWKKAPLLINQQIGNIGKLAQSAIELRRGIVPLPLPSMVKDFGEDLNVGVSVEGRGLNGSGDTFRTNVAWNMGDGM